MKGIKYTTPDGKTHEVLDFDEVNHMAYICIERGQYRWVHESEYAKWEVSGTAGNQSQSKIEDNALQKPSAGSVFQHPQEGTGEEGGERDGVEQSIKGDEVTQESEVEGEEKVIKTRKPRIKKEK